MGNGKMKIRIFDWTDILKKNKWFGQKYSHDQEKARRIKQMVTILINLVMKQMKDQKVIVKKPKQED